MEDFLFVLGSNFRLSLSELDNVLKNSQFKGRIKDYSANIAIVEFESLLEDDHYINSLMNLQFLLGGCQKIARVFDFIDIHTIKTGFPTHIDKFKLVERTRNKIKEIIGNCLDNIFRRIRNKNLFYAVSIYPNLFDDEYYPDILVKHFLPFLNTEIMAILYEKGAKKALYYSYPEKNIKSGHLNPIFPHVVIKYGLFNEDRAELIFGFTEEGVYIARTFTADDPNFKKKIDEEKPFKEFKSSISPKLALIMLNFLNLFEKRESKKILDPFVGNGTMLLFALIQDFQIYGSDIDAKSVEHTNRNVNWLLEELEEEVPLFLSERLKAADVKDLSNTFEGNFFDGICTEPFLGPYYKKKPYYIQARHLIDTEITPLYESIFREAYKVLKSKGRVCITSPIISTIDGKDLQPNVKQIAINNNFKLIPMVDAERIINKSNIKLQFQRQHLTNLIDAKKGQIVKRKFFIFEKQD
ncbi:MAG: TRM11 family SAM-dependent methyltransferase [Promethearchaeota archaeon]